MTQSNRDIIEAYVLFKDLIEHAIQCPECQQKLLSICEHADYIEKEVKIKQ